MPEVQVSWPARLMRVAHSLLPRLILEGGEMAWAHIQ